MGGGVTGVPAASFDSFSLAQVARPAVSSFSSSTIVTLQILVKTLLQIENSCLPGPPGIFRTLEGLESLCIAQRLLLSERS